MFYKLKIGVNILLYPVQYFFILENPHWELIEPRCEPKAYPVPQKNIATVCLTLLAVHRPHKVITYIEYRAVSGVFQTIDPPPPSSPSEGVLPPHQRRGGGGLHTRRAVRGVGGQ
jgi:hypothetical protein